MNKNYIISIVPFVIITSNLMAQMPIYKMPAENAVHEGTWLQWPHDYTYGSGYRAYNEPAWIEMTRQLLKGEYVHIIAYNGTEQTHIQTVLTDAGISLDSVDFYIHPNNDFWIRDNGPVFVTDQDDYLYATDWNFDGWGNDAPYSLDNQIPALISGDRGIPLLDLSAVTLEGGAVEHDGNGTFMGTLSSITGDGRNTGLTTTDIESYMTEYFGFTNFIWLDGYYGAGWDITDAHIDGFVKFVDENTILTMNTTDLIYWFVSAADRTKINSATNVDGDPYNYVYLPLTHKNVKTTDGINTGSKGDYINYYVANAVVLVPVYMDVNDATALATIQTLYPDKEVVGIDSRNMFNGGGMVHCVTQQQPFTCAKPRNLVATGITETSAIISWDAIPLTDSYKVTKKLIGGGISNYTVTDNTISLTGLLPGSTYKISIKGKCDGTFGAKSLSLTVHTPGRFGDSDNGTPIDIGIYPNPATDQINILSDHQFTSVEIINVNGIGVAHLASTDEPVISISDFPEGLYIAIIYFDKEFVVRKFIIAR